MLYGDNASWDLRKQFETYWDAELRQSLSTLKEVIVAEVESVFPKLETFARDVSDQGLNVAAGKLLGHTGLPNTVLEAVESAANALTLGLRDIDRKLALKSIQETFIYATGVGVDATISDFEAQFRKYIETRGTDALAQLFFRLHLFNTICGKLHDSLQKNAPDIRSWEAAMKKMDEMCSTGECLPATNVDVEAYSSSSVEGDTATEGSLFTDKPSQNVQ